MAAIRKLIVLCDGTNNEPEQLDNGQAAPTNVVKLYNALASDGGKQIPNYEEGVGTRVWEALPGGMYGYGLDKRILANYRFLRKRFADSDWERDENKVFLFGFSRGAYTVRRLAGLIAHSGIPVKPSDDELGWELYRKKDTVSSEKLKKEGRFFDIPVEMIGVWDTVKATNDEDYHDSQLSPNVISGYHAMSIDERRKFFPVLKWDNDARVHQVWFAGVHSDVGGGYADAGLSDTALRWMIDRAMELDMKFKAQYVNQKVVPSAAGSIHNSYEGKWIPLGAEQRSIPDTDFVHPSVKDRMDANIGYKPANLPANPNYWKAL
ncbi:MAG: DUF2235 domain-containing protein [Victivallales bacterium]